MDRSIAEPGDNARASTPEQRIQAALSLHQPYSHEFLGEVCSECSASSEFDAWMLGEGYILKDLVQMPCPTVRALEPGDAG